VRLGVRPRNCLQTTDVPAILGDELQDEARRLRARFEAAIEPHRESLWRYCRRLTGSIWAAEDLAQDTIARALGRLAHFGQVLNPWAYLFRIATNAWLDQQKRTAPESLDARDDLAAPAASNNAGEISDAMTELVTAMSPRQRVVWLLWWKPFPFGRRKLPQSPAPRKEP
jgi:RNA polymerase sigma-70 factor (ECF subfamily)